MINVVEIRPDSPVDALLEYLSPSAVKDYLGCSLRYYFGRVEKLPQPSSPSLVLGKAVHAALRVHHLGRWRDQPSTPEATHREFDEALEEFLTKDELAITSEEREGLKSKGRAMIKAYLSDDHATDNRKVTGVEVAIRERFPGLPSEMAGQVDLVLQESDGGLVPVDFKTTACTPNLEIEGFQHELQMVFYQLLIEAATGQQVSYREIVYLTKHKEPRVIVQRIPRADETAQMRFWSMVGSAYSGIRNERWVPQPGTQCSWCAFRESCSRWDGKGGAS